jgi:transposase
VALALQEPWSVASATFDPDAGRLDVDVVFLRGSQFDCPKCQAPGCEVHDTAPRTWRHMDFFQHKAFLTARVPRVRCAEHGVLQVPVPWAREGSGFTLLFEALVCSMAPHMPVSRVARMVREHDTRIWRVLGHYVEKARAAEDHSQVSVVGVDETSSRRGHNYVSVFMDLSPGRRRVLYACSGRNAAAVGAFALDLAAHGGDAERITHVCCDMSPAYISGIAASFEGAQITFDRYHVIAQLNKAVDLVRRAEVKTKPELKGTRYLWLKNHDSLSERQIEELAWLLRPSLKLATMRAWRWRIDFDGFFFQKPEHAEAYLKRWCEGAKRSRLEPIKDFVKLVYKHWDGILAWHTSPISNGILEATNSLIQAAKRKARGYRNNDNLITMIYLVAGRLPLPSPHAI